jgi:hypothetical protein
MVGRGFVAAALGVLVAVPAAWGSDVRYYEQNGVTYCETRRTVEERIPESRMVEHSQTVYREEFTTEFQESTRTYWTPVTEYRWEPYLAGRWNPFIEPYVAYRQVPHTRWEQRTEVVRVPVSTRRLVPETRTVRQPVASFRTVQRDVVNRVAVSPSPTRSPLNQVTTPALATRPTIGGISRLDKDPPRQGTSTAWRASTDTYRR